MWSCFKPRTNEKSSQSTYNLSNDIWDHRSKIKRISSLEKEVQYFRQYLDHLNGIVSVTQSPEPSSDVQKVKTTSKFLLSDPCYKDLSLEYMRNISDISNKILRKAFDLKNKVVESESKGGSSHGGQCFVRSESSHVGQCFVRSESCHGRQCFVRGESSVDVRSGVHGKFDRNKLIQPMTINNLHSTKRINNDKKFHRLEPII